MNLDIVYNENCLEGMRELPNNSIDLRGEKMKKWYEIGVIDDIRTSWKDIFMAFFYDSTEEIAKETAKQYKERKR